MRIVAGDWKGRQLAHFRAEIRPTGDRLREAFFASQEKRIPGSVWLDAFAGTGAIGLEAISRGARRVVFNDRGSSAQRLIQRNMAICGLEEGYELHRLDIFVLLRTLEPPQPLDFVYLDPPFDFGRYEKLLGRVARSAWVGPKTRLALEVHRKTRLEGFPNRLILLNTLKAGDSLLHVLGVPDPA